MPRIPAWAKEMVPPGGNKCVPLRPIEGVNFGGKFRFWEISNLEPLRESHCVGVHLMGELLSNRSNPKNLRVF